MMQYSFSAEASNFLLVEKNVVFLESTGKGQLLKYCFTETHLVYIYSKVYLNNLILICYNGMICKILWFGAGCNITGGAGCNTIQMKKMMIPTVLSV